MTDVVATVEAGRTVVEPDWVMVDAGTMTLVVTVEASITVVCVLTMTEVALTVDAGTVIVDAG